jgi:hypothetical protein
VAILAILMADQALAESGFQEPRPSFRDRLRHFREEAPAAYSAGVEYYEKTLVPALAAEDVDPLLAWIEYGRRLGELAGRGNGRARPYRHELRYDALVLHVPDDTAIEVLALAIPTTLAPPQKATLDLLVHRARGLV